MDRLARASRELHWRFAVRAILVSGAFRLTDDQTGFGRQVDLFGSGIATVTFGPYGSPEYPNAFGTQSVRFDFADVAPTPEPASLLLLGTGVCGLVAARRRRARP